VLHLAKILVKKARYSNLLEVASFGSLLCFAAGAYFISHVMQLVKVSVETLVIWVLLFPSKNSAS
jgi:hypothetical protein